MPLSSVFTWTGFLPSSPAAVPYILGNIQGAGLTNAASRAALPPPNEFCEQQMNSGASTPPVPRKDEWTGPARAVSTCISQFHHPLSQGSSSQRSGWCLFYFSSCCSIEGSSKLHLESFAAHTINVQQASFGEMEEGNQRKFPSRLPLLFAVQKIILNVVYHHSN